jgi:hypothetical protein
MSANYLFALISAASNSTTAAAQAQLADGAGAAGQLMIEETAYSKFTYSINGASFTEQPWSFHPSYMKASSFVNMLRAAEKYFYSQAGRSRPLSQIGLGFVYGAVAQEFSYAANHPSDANAVSRAMHGRNSITQYGGAFNGLVDPNACSLKLLQRIGAFTPSYLSHKVTGNVSLGVLAAHLNSTIANGTTSEVTAANTLYNNAKTEQQNDAQQAGGGVEAEQAQVCQDGNNAQADAGLASAVIALLSSLTANNGPM